MQQLRLFPRDQRLPVAVVGGDGDCHLTVRRRVRRSRRLEPIVVPARDLVAAPGRSGTRRSGTDWFGAGWSGPPDTRPEAVLLPLAAGDNDPGALLSLLERVGDTPVVCVDDGSGLRAARALELGVEEVLPLEVATTARLEQAVFAAVHRRSSRSHVRRRSGDPLTGLATRSTLELELPAMLETAGDTGVAVLYCDLDRFKGINDTLGHGAGDQVLREAARRLRHAVRSSDTVVRLGGDEFVVVLRSPGRIDHVAEEVADRILQAFTEPFAVDDDRLTISISLGLARHRAGESSGELLERADRALYQAKRRGKARVARYDDVLDRTEEARAVSERMLAEALRRDLLETEAHPIVSTGSQRIVGHVFRTGWGRSAIALRRPTPAATPEAVAAGTSASAVFEWTLARLPGGDTARTLAGTGAPMWVQMPRSVLAASPARSLEVAARSGTATDRLVVVIDEDALGDSGSVRSGLLEVARRGARVAIGRFGAHTGALALLDRHPFDAVWLDRQLVDGLAADEVRRAKLVAVAGVAGALGQRVVVDRPVNPLDATAVAELADVLMVDGNVDLTGGTPTIALPPRAAGAAGRLAGGLPLAGS